MNREAIILAGGAGSRLKPLVSDRPKPMALIDNRPFLSYLLKYLEKNGFTRIILAVGYKHQIVSDYFEDRFGAMEIVYAIEDKPLGTGGAILNALRSSLSEKCFILNGDTYFQVSFDEMEKTAKKYQADLVMAVRQLGDISRYGTLTLDREGKIIGFIEKNGRAEPGYINGGVYLLDKTCFSQHDFARIFSFENDYLMQFYRSGRFFATISQGYFIDIGIPETYRQAQTDFFHFEQ